MKNAGLTIGMCAIGLGLASIGFNLNGNQANATPAAIAPAGGAGEPTIVWYEVEGTQHFISTGGATYTSAHVAYRAWSDGTIEGKIVDVSSNPSCSSAAPCTTGWFIISSPNEGLNAAADINFDSRVDAADLGQLLAAWGDAPRNDYPPSDCPLGLIP